MKKKNKKQLIKPLISISCSSHWNIEATTNILVAYDESAMLGFIQAVPNIVIAVFGRV